MEVDATGSLLKAKTHKDWETAMGASQECFCNIVVAFNYVKEVVKCEDFYAGIQCGEKCFSVCSDRGGSTGRYSASLASSWGRDCAPSRGYVNGGHLTAGSVVVSKVSAHIHPGGEGAAAGFAGE